MNSLFLGSRRWWVGLLLIGSIMAAAAAPTNATVVARAKTMDAPKAPATNSLVSVRTLLEQPLPQSAFALPRKAVEGKDPFFPRSTRIYGTDAAPAPTPKPSVAAELVLKGISGTPEAPLAIINTTTFTAGETNEVLTKTGRVRVACLEINMTAGTALIAVGSEQRELQLQPQR